MFKSALEKTIVLNIILIMIFKEIITHTEVINRLPEFFGQLSIPISLVFALIFFFGTLISVASAIISLCMTMAMVTVNIMFLYYCNIICGVIGDIFTDVHKIPIYHN